MVETVLSIAGTVFAIFFLLDMFYQKKEKYYFITRFIAIITVSMPAFMDGLDFWKDKKEYFYIAFFISILVGFILGMVWLYFFIIKKIPNDSKNYGLQLLSAIYDGFKLFKQQLDKDMKKIEKDKVKYDKTLLSVHKDLKKELPKFITSIYRDVNLHDDFSSYAYYVMDSFVTTFLSGNDARFTLRQIDETNIKMVTVLTTRDEKPADIPINTKNMILLSMKDKEPKIYSRNVDYHYETNGSIQKGLFNDYVTFCILDDGDIPIVSLNLDVSGEQAKRRMEVLVDTAIFQIVCESLIVYLERDGEMKNV